MRNAIATQEATIGRHKEFHRGLVVGVQTLTERRDAVGQFAEAIPQVFWEAAYHGGNLTAPQQLSC